MKQLVSVIVPVYCVEEYIDRCVLSIVNQSYRDLEIILVDDGSLDNTSEICDLWSREDRRIKVIHKGNGGPSSARNIGIEAAHGDFLAFVDGDDWISEDMFEKVIDIFDQYNPDIVTFGCARVNDKGIVYASTEHVPEGMMLPETAMHELLKGNINNYAVNKVYKKHVFDGIRFPEGRVFEDMATAYKLILNCDSVYCCAENLYFYFTRQGSISKAIDEKAIGDIFLARYECHIAMLNECPSAASLSFSWVALSARRLYDCSLWGSVDAELLSLAKAFLADNRESVLEQESDIKFRIFYNFPKAYAFLRTLKHDIGKVVRKLR